MEQHNSSMISSAPIKVLSVQTMLVVKCWEEVAKYRQKYPVTTSTWDVVVKIFPLNNVETIYYAVCFRQESIFQNSLNTKFNLK